jgi:hypothetical protein
MKVKNKYQRFCFRESLSVQYNNWINAVKFDKVHVVYKKAIYKGEVVYIGTAFNFILLPCSVFVPWVPPSLLSSVHEIVLFEDKI